MKPNCYECKWRGALPGDCHSCCNHPKVSMRENPATAMVSLLGLGLGKANPLGVIGDPHGMKKGWFLWPLNFDPVWLESCNGFERKEVKVDECANGK